MVRASSCGVVPKTVENGLDGYTFGYTARLAFCEACNLLRSGPHADSRAVYDDEGVGQFVLCHLTDQPPQCLLGFFNRRRPNPKAHNAMVGAGMGAALHPWTKCDQHDDDWPGLK